MQLSVLHSLMMGILYSLAGNFEDLDLAGMVQSVLGDFDLEASLNALAGLDSKKRNVDAFKSMEFIANENGFAVEEH